MTYLQKKKQALLNYVNAQPSGYDVTMQFHFPDYTIDVTINGETNTYTLADARNIIDCGCVYLEYGLSGQYEIFTKGTTTYNGVEYSKGKRTNIEPYNSNNTCNYYGVNEIAPSGATEFYMPDVNRCLGFTDTEYKQSVLSGTPTQIGCIEWSYAGGRTTIVATKKLSYNGVIYNIGDTVATVGYGGTLNAIFEEV